MYYIEDHKRALLLALCPIKVLSTLVSFKNGASPSNISFTRINLVFQKHGNKDLQLRPTTKTNTNFMCGSADGQLSEKSLCKADIHKANSFNTDTFLLHQMKFSTKITSIKRVKDTESKSS